MCELVERHEGHPSELSLFEERHQLCRRVVAVNDDVENRVAAGNLSCVFSGY